MPGVTLNFEAAVRRHAAHPLAADGLPRRQHQMVMGIMNGTTNSMLSKMEDEGADYGGKLFEDVELYIKFQIHRGES